MAGRLAGKVALITGGAAGMGAAFVRVFAAEGAKVVAADIQDELGRKVADSVNRSGGEAIYVHLDTSQQSDWANAVAQTVKRFGKLTTLCNVAGIYRTEGTEAETIEGWQQIIAVDQTGVWFGMKAAIPEIRKGGRWCDRQHLFGGRLVGAADRDCVPRGQGRRASDDQSGGARVCGSWNSRQLHSSRLHHDLDRLGAARRGQEGPGERGSAQTRRDSRRDCLRRPIPVLR